MPITKLCFKFLVDKIIKFQSYSGFASRGIFFDMLKRQDENYALTLHSGRGLAPYSTSPIMIRENGKTRVIYKLIKPYCLAYVNFTLLDNELSRLFKELIMEGISDIKLIDKSFPVIGVSINTVSFKELLEKAKPVKRFTLTFQSPCYLRMTPKSSLILFPSKRCSSDVKRGYRFYLFPEPILLFRNLIRLWRRFSDTWFNYMEFMEWIEAGGVAISGFPKGIRTVRIYEHPTLNKWVVGFIGTVRFNLPEDVYDRRFASIVDALLRFAKHSNVGGGRTAGLGMIEYKPVDFFNEK